MRHTEYCYISPAENHCYRGLERWLDDKKKRERRAKKHGAFSLDKNKEEAIMNFGEAIKALKLGNRVARKGWNGKGMFIYLESGTLITPDKIRNLTLAKSTPDSQKYININPHIDMKSADGSIVVGWLASQTDLLANDWEIVK
ncbi:hypothetical protein IWT25_02362 [Secundilactobacillus pentosiphilus]|uniref:Thoeris anti-defense 2-like domain-containing protein n=1 Tax=Secundilactobacillus pentosiphilus TaxID=1714682 RepID=A0A1Z5IYZ6_9LACO|nr:DUF2829 domain-containing protein [Secundilactobacillus pentosiphilus]GAX07014.1 hypothetical protein IWT25_02362 [Secundilactobacillus pentosiphilus]